MFNDRILQFEYAYLSIQEKLFTGYGLDKYAYIDKSLVPIYLKDKIIGAHNGYLAIFTQYGVIFGSVMLFLIFRKSLQAYSYFKSKNSFERGYWFIIFYTLIASIYESLMTGINEFNTILFWFSLAILSYSMFLKENES
jgi:O-antigen ligase